MVKIMRKTMNINNKTYLTVLIIVLALFTILNFSSCDDGPTEPNVEPGRRDYTWVADTLKVPYGEFTSVDKIWGANSSDLWLACGNSSSNPYRLFHFDGINWGNHDVGFPIVSAWGVYGFNRNDVWLCTSKGQIARFEGLNWKSLGNFSPEGEILRLNGFSGPNLDNFYSFGFLDKIDRSGYKGCILKYAKNKVNWEFIEIGDVKVGFSSMVYDSKIKSFFLSGYRFEDGMQIIYKFSSNKLEKLYESTKETKVLTLNNRAYFMVGKKIYNYDNSNGINIWKDFSDIEGFAGPIIGRNEKDIFTATFGKGIGHFNGNDIEILYETDLWFRDSILFDEDVFFVCFNPETSVDAIIHGKLNTN